MRRLCLSGARERPRDLHGPLRLRPRDCALHTRARARPDAPSNADSGQGSVFAVVAVAATSPNPLTGVSEGGRSRKPAIVSAGIGGSLGGSDDAVSSGGGV